MITIDCPTIEKKGKEVFLQAIIKDDILKLRFPLWYSVDECYGPYLCEDRGDAFLLVSLMYAMKSHQDVFVNAPVSKRFLYNINYVIQPLLSKLIPDSSCVKITVLDGECPEFKGKAVGCGCSLGVDSMSSLYRHMGNDVMKEYRVTHLALFNSCQLGYLNKSLDESSFREAVKGLSSFSSEVGLPIVAVNTNLNDFFIEAGFKTAKSRFVVSTISCPLALQKLFGKYIYASSTPLQSFELSQTDQSFAEAAYVPLLSTESTEIILADASLTRVEKTAYISKNPLTHKYLDVCWATQAASSISHIDKWLKGKTKKNCGWCDKCLRTLFTLELLGEDLQKYDGIFDLSKYYVHKNGFIKTVILNKHKDHLYQEIFSLMSEKHFKVPRRVKYSVMKAKVYRFIRGIRSRLSFPKSL
jgi:hypothetical protein